MFNFFKKKSKSKTEVASLTQQPTKKEPTYLEKRVLYIKEQERKFSDEVQSIPRVEVLCNGEKVKKRAVSDMPEYTFSSITSKTNIEKVFPIIVIDTETTGIKIRGNDIIEVSAIKFNAEFAPVSAFSTLVNIKGDIPQEITDITHITKEMILDKPFFYQVKASFNEFISGCNIVGHNLEFDMKFLYANGVDFEQGKIKYYDTLKIAQKILKKPKVKYCADVNSYEIDYDSDYDVENHKLETLCDYYSIFRNDAHRSLSDCYATGLLFKKLLEEKCII